MTEAQRISAGMASDDLASIAGADLTAYLDRPEPEYIWEQKSLTRNEDGSVQTLGMVSQNWQGNRWEHDLVVFRSASPSHPELCLIYNTGGNAKPGDMALGTMMARETGCTVAILFGVPNQPLYGVIEDALIVYTWQQYMRTGDETWPLQFPMVKSLIKAMDTVQASAKAANQPPVTKFIVTGMSKRGWAAWLTGASGDERIVAIAPMVIEVLNMHAQPPHQLAMYGQASDETNDYSLGGFPDALKTPAGRRLVEMVDPYSMRAKLTLPKLIVLGTNDSYWSQDALNLYWDGLPGPKWVLYDPNSGHGLEDGDRVTATLSSFTRALASHKPWPKPDWTWNTTASGARLTVTSNLPIPSARLFRAESGTTDFRQSIWTSTEVMAGKTITVDAPRPAGGYAASYVELSYEQDGHPFTLSTQIRILEAGQ